MDEQTLRYAEEMMREYCACETGAVCVKTRLKRLKKRLTTFAFQLLKEDEPEIVAQTGGVFTRICSFFRRGSRKILRLLVQKLIVLVLRS